MLVKLSAASKDRPPNSFVSGIQDAFQLLQDIFSVRYALVQITLDDFVHRFEQQLLWKHYVGPAILTISANPCCTHRRKALVRANRPCIGGRRSSRLAVVLEDRRARCTIKAEIVDPLPVSGDDTGSRVVVG